MFTLEEKNLKNANPSTYEGAQLARGKGKLV